MNHVFVVGNTMTSGTPSGPTRRPRRDGRLRPPVDDHHGPGSATAGQNATGGPR